LLQQLYSSVGILSDVVAPATVTSIYLTSAFLRDEMSSSASPEAKLVAQRLRRWAITTALSALLVFVVTIMLLTHVDRGRRYIEQVGNARDEYQLVISAINQARDPRMLADCVKGLPGSDTLYPQPGVD
jgi:hypothetical protein